MAKAVSIFAVLFLLFVVALEVRKIEATSDECKKQYVGDATAFQLCSPLILPRPCQWACIDENGAEGGLCEGGECVCDFCNNPFPPFPPFPMQANAA